MVFFFFFFFFFVQKSEKKKKKKTQVLTIHCTEEHFFRIKGMLCQPSPFIIIKKLYFDLFWYLLNYSAAKSRICDLSFL